MALNRGIWSIWTPGCPYRGRSTQRKRDQDGRKSPSTTDQHEGTGTSGREDPERRARKGLGTGLGNPPSPAPKRIQDSHWNSPSNQHHPAQNDNTQHPNPTNTHTRYAFLVGRGDRMGSTTLCSGRPVAPVTLRSVTEREILEKLRSRKVVSRILPDGLDNGQTRGIWSGHNLIACQ